MIVINQLHIDNGNVQAQFVGDNRKSWMSMFISLEDY